MKIHLGPLPDSSTMKISITLPVPLKARLDRYAELHAATWRSKPVDTAALIAHMLAQFLAKDRAFRKAEKRAGSANTFGPLDKLSDER